MVKVWIALRGVLHYTAGGGVRRRAEGRIWARNRGRRSQVGGSVALRDWMEALRVGYDWDRRGRRSRGRAVHSDGRGRRPCTDQLTGKALRCLLYGILTLKPPPIDKETRVIDFTPLTSVTILTRELSQMPADHATITARCSTRKITSRPYRLQIPHAPAAPPPVTYPAPSNSPK